jgi:tetratricopeptide (TPR) repeat protein
VAQCRRALEILEEIGELQHQPHVLIHLGDGLMGLNDISGAADAFDQALELLRASGPEQAVVKPLAGLARVALAQGDPARALAYVEELLPHLATMDDPYHVYLTCYRVYQANDDARAKEILATAHRLLQENAALLSGEASRRSFLENVRINREIVQEFARLHSDE